jgi:hypothetical protein
MSPEIQNHPVCAVLAGAWRAEAGTANVSPDMLSASLDLLTSTGAGGLAWRRIAADRELRETLVGLALRRTAQAQAIDAARHEQALAALARLLIGCGVTPLVFKGWAIARYYGEPRLRPLGDIDLLAPPGGFEAIDEVLRRAGFHRRSLTNQPHRGRVADFTAPEGFPGKRVSIDLQERLDHLFMPPVDALFARAASTPLEDLQLLTLAAEDHLRLVAIHFLQHGGWRAVSLCDVAAVLETLPPDFDWETCLGAEPRRRNWVVSVFFLARFLLDARAGANPESLVDGNPPGWLTSAILQEWERPFSAHHAKPLLSYLWRRNRIEFIRQIVARWPNPVRATVELDAGFNAVPRWPYQARHFLRSVYRAIAGRV